MKVIYVNKRYEASMLKHAFGAAGFRVFRVRTECQCQQKDNRRDGLIVLDSNKVLLEIRRCKECFKRQNPQLLAGGVGEITRNMEYIYELSQDGQSIGRFTTVDDARQYAATCPAGTYRIMEFEIEYEANGVYQAHYLGVNLCAEFYNWVAI